MTKRWDYIIGLRKYWGPAAYPQDTGIIIGLLPDILCVFTLLMTKRYLVEIGMWDYVRIRESIYKTPCFKGDDSSNKAEKENKN